MLPPVVWVLTYHPIGCKLPSTHLGARIINVAIKRYGRFDINIRDQVDLTWTENMAETLCDTLCFAKSRNRELYVYYDGVYRPVNDDIAECHKQIYKGEIQGSGWRRERYIELKEYILIGAPELLTTPDPNRINMLNGIYFIQEEKFESHEIDHSGYLTDIQVPIIYDESATCPDVDKFMLEVLPEGQPVDEDGELREGHILYDIYGICLTSDRRQHKAIMLKGGGNNGKSIYLYGLRRLVGDTNCAANTIHELCDKNDKFVHSSLIGKLVNAGDDTDKTPIVVTDKLKAIISGNKIRTQEKFKKQIDEYPFCKLIFSTNHELMFPEDDTTGIKKRIMSVPLRVTFPFNASKELELHRMFDDSKNISGMFNRIKVRLREVMQNQIGYDMSAELISISDNYVVIPNAYENWLKENVISASEGVGIQSERLLLVMTYMLSDVGQLGDGFTQAQLRRWMKHLYPNVRPDANCRFNGVQTKCYAGVGFIREDVAKLSASMITRKQQLELQKVWALEEEILNENREDIIN